MSSEQNKWDITLYMLMIKAIKIGEHSCKSRQIYRVVPQSQKGTNWN